MSAWSGRHGVDADGSSFARSGRLLAYLQDVS